MDAAKKHSIAEDQAYQQNVDQLFQNVRKSGLQMLDNISNDSNCMFHAVADQMNRLGEFGHSHITLRHLAVETAKRITWCKWFSLPCFEKKSSKSDRDRNYIKEIVPFLTL